MSIAKTVKEFKPNILLGLSSVPGIFDEETIRAMADHNTVPIIMPMSNPTSKSECTPQQAYEWTDGRAVVATGSPFQPVIYNGKKLIPSQCNNMYIFPGIGLAASVSGVTKITDKMFYLASEACVKTMTKEEIAEGRTFPNIVRIRECAKNVAVAIIEEAIREGLTTKLTKKDIQDGIPQLVQMKMYFPTYAPLISKE
jgi:malate dehydrogenase (oxaloacetate-decarboxylating)(NADP+)